MTTFLILLGSGIGTAEIFVQPGDSIQAAVDNATSSGDVIILKPGTYTENIKVNTNNLEIKSESGNPDDTIIKAENSNDNVISLLQANNVKVSGLEITGTKNIYAGIYLSGCNNCIIDHNKLLGNSYGMYVLNSTGNTLLTNIVTDNGDYGILFSTANGNTLSDNTASNNKRGIHIGTSDGNKLSGNTISLNSVYGLYVCPKSDNNVVFNNYFNNTVNGDIKNGTGNSYNTTKSAGTNIVAGLYIGGNFWAKPDGTGFSQTAVDGDGDGIADSGYKLEKSIYADQLPLVSASGPQQPVIPVANFEMSTANGSAPLSVQFTDYSENAVSLSWDFENDGVVDSTDKNPVRMYESPGTYTVNLTAASEKGTASKTAIITVTQAIGDNSGNSGTGDNGTEDSGSSSSGSSHSSHRSEGSSGGGGGGSPEPQSNVEAKEISQFFITSGNPVKFDFSKNATSVVYVSFDSKKTVGRTTAIAEMLKEKSTLVSGLPSGEVYKSLNIWVGDGGFGTSKNIENAVICFKVEKSWTQDNNIDTSSITLNRYDNGKWGQLPVNLTGKDNGFLYFTAKTPGFSSFAITGKAKTGETAVTNSQPASQPVSQSGFETGNLSKEGNVTALGSGVGQALENRASTKSPGFETVYGVISLIALFFYKKK